jgi:translation initiation factor IF-1
MLSGMAGCSLALHRSFRHGRLRGRCRAPGVAVHDKESRMSKEDLVQFEGVVEEVLRDARFMVKLENGINVAAYASGKMRKFRIRILAGDRVTLEMSPYDLTKARICFRHKEQRVRPGAAADAVRPH